MPLTKHRSPDPETTASLAAQICGHWLHPGVLIRLYGHLGAGKTCFVRGLARALNMDESLVQSPTYSILNQYSTGNVPLYHADLYRLDSPEQFWAAGIDESWMDVPGVVVVEWPDRLPQALIDEFAQIVDVSLEMGAHPDERIIRIYGNLQGGTQC